MKIFKTNFAGNQFCFVIWSFQWKLKTVSENVQICGQTIPTYLNLQPFPCNPMSLTCLWLKANSKATQCNVRIVPWIHCSSETRDLHQAFTPSSKNIPSMKFFEQHILSKSLKHIFPNYICICRNCKMYLSKPTSRLCSFTERGCKAPHFRFLQWNFLKAQSAGEI